MPAKKIRLKTEENRAAIDNKKLILPPPKRLKQTSKNNSGKANGDRNNYGDDKFRSRNPIPWLKTKACPALVDDKNISKQASFVEYLRWQRTQIDDSTVDNGTVLELLKKIEDGNYSRQLNRLTERTRRLADQTIEAFEVRCPWRIRVGGTKAPELMMLPAFDALGMPYIPSSSLRGVAREIARQEVLEEDNNFTEQELNQIFGNIDPDNSSMGQVIFLDAYPLPGENKKGGLKPDMTNAIWEWEKNKLKYNPNPNTFLSLEKPTFVIGLRRTKNCPDKILERVKNWLIKGLAQGIGSRVNSGYGALKPIDKELKQQAIVKKTILKVPFELKGQLIHGQQRFDRWQQNDNGNWKLKSNPVSEVRSTAFRCMLRYWFRAFTLGAIPNTSPSIRQLEMQIFGGINDDRSESTNGLFRLETTGKIESYGDDHNPPLMSGIITIRHNAQSYRESANKREALEKLLTSLTWLMFHLGGVGQGARRPCYCRGFENRNGRQRQKNPYWRGSSLIPDSEGEYKLWNLPDSLSEFRTLFQSHLSNFYSALATYSGQETNSSELQTISTDTWAEAIDANCKIFVCKGRRSRNKCFALSVLHQPPFYRNREVCGGNGTPSPVWIRSLNYCHDWQVVTIFGATTGMREDFVTQLKQDAVECLQIFPL